MCERFTDQARKVLTLANQEAVRHKHECVATQHLLLGLVKEGTGRAVTLLGNHHINLKLLEREVKRLLTTGTAAVTMRELPLTPLAKRVVAYATDEARALDHDSVGTEHLLLGLMWDSETAVAHVLMNLGLKLDDLRDEVRRLREVNYRDLDIWKAATELVYHVYLTTKAFPAEEADGIARQLRKAALSIPTNIAKGYVLKNRSVLRCSVSLAQGSLAELQYLLDFSLRLEYLSETAHRSLSELAAAAGKGFGEFRASAHE